MKKIIIGLIFGLLSVGANAQMNCDSTCLGGSLTVIVQMPKAQTIQGTNTVQIAPMTSTQSAKITYGTCPSGFTYYGSSQYPISQIVTITYSRNGQLVGTNTMPSQDLDNDCTAVQYQSLQCPSGQTGSITQMRNVSTGSGGYEYGSWTTTSNSCVANNGVWTWLGWDGGQVSNECIYNANLVNKGSCSPVGQMCLFKDDQTRRKGTYQCR